MMVVTLVQVMAALAARLRIPRRGCSTKLQVGQHKDGDDTEDGEKVTTMYLES
jgi:hypothetical protein